MTGPQLSACRINIITVPASERRLDTVLHNHIIKVKRPSLITRAKSVFTDFIIGNEIHVGIHPADEVSELFRVCIAVVDILQKDVLKGQPAVIVFTVFLQRLHELIQRIGPVDRHQLPPQCIIGRMEGNGKIVLVVSLGKAADRRDNPAGADRDTWVRMPLARGVNDDPAALRDSARFLMTLNNLRRVDLLPVLNHASEKYRALGLTPPRFNEGTDAAGLLRRAAEILSEASGGRLPIHEMI